MTLNRNVEVVLCSQMCSELLKIDHFTVLAEEVLLKCMAVFPGEGGRSHHVLVLALH